MPSFQKSLIVEQFQGNYLNTISTESFLSRRVKKDSAGRVMSPLLPQISLFLCRESHVNLIQLAVICTHDRDVRGMGLFSIQYVTSCFEFLSSKKFCITKQFVT